jgi:hypothetical protein
VENMSKAEAKKVLDESLNRFRDEVDSWISTTPTSFDWKQKEEIHHLMKQVFYTLNDFKKVIEKIDE